jgi:hypothetical protein
MRPGRPRGTLCCGAGHDASIRAPRAPHDLSKVWQKMGRACRQVSEMRHVTLRGSYRSDAHAGQHGDLPSSRLRVQRTLRRSAPDADHRNDHASLPRWRMAIRVDPVDICMFLPDLRRKHPASWPQVRPAAHVPLPSTVHAYASGDLRSLGRAHTEGDGSSSLASNQGQTWRFKEGV